MAKMARALSLSSASHTMASRIIRGMAKWQPSWSLIVKRFVLPIALRLNVEEQVKESLDCGRITMPTTTARTSAIPMETRFALHVTSRKGRLADRLRIVIFVM